MDVFDELPKHVRFELFYDERLVYVALGLGWAWCMFPWGWDGLVYVAMGLGRGLLEQPTKQ